MSCLGFNELSKKLPQSLKRIFIKSRKEHHILKSDDYTIIFEESKICNRGIAVAQNNGDVLVFDITSKRFCGFSHETGKCVYGRKLYSEYIYYVELATVYIDYDHELSNKQILTIKHALKIKYHHDFYVEYDKEFREIVIYPIVKSDKDLIKVLSFISFKYLKDVRSLVLKILNR